MKKILVVGSLNMDIVLGMDRLPRSGETVIGNSLRYTPGGKGANQAFAIARLGGNVAMLGCVGDDNLGVELRDNLAAAGVDVGAVRRVQGQATGTAVINVDKGGANSIVVIPGANHACDVAYLQENDDAFRQCDYLVLQLEIPLGAVWYAVNRASVLGKTVILNPAPAPGMIPAETMRCIDYLSPNETELERLSGCACGTMEEIRQGAARLHASGVKSILVTVGSRGSLLLDDSGTTLTPGTTHRPVDTTAAGDCFNGAFVTALAEGKSPAQAAVFANTAAGIAITRKGAQTSIPTRHEVDIYTK